MQPLQFQDIDLSFPAHRLGWLGLDMRVEAVSFYSSRGGMWRGHGGRAGERVTWRVRPCSTHPVLVSSSGCGKVYGVVTPVDPLPFLKRMRALRPRYER